MIFSLRARGKHCTFADKTVLIFKVWRNANAVVVTVVQEFGRKLIFSTGRKKCSQIYQIAHLGFI